ncbi:hypothetical protein CBQ26_01235 [Deinococcus indicus]|uniref:DUF2089 domain-containing protein n=1 Tax=Deinococcus indicus TaxID=223556 RepID=A0A246BSW0_9DEIO|nr:hypothetical protein [Deinococcus indicus]OWL98755.1 hypothetical protein CBQ26_01235 [Deinococcus indicus]GHG38028.1 hypothetical protein GCM10017784_35710 [Deinococcus indicus]
MKDKIRRILDLIRAGRLTLDDAAPLLAALHTRLALQVTDRELLAALLNREELTADQIAEQLMLLRGVPDSPNAPQAPRPPQASRPPEPPRRPQVVIGSQRVRGLEDLVERFTDRFTGGIDEMVDRLTQQTTPPAAAPAAPRVSARILRIEIESSDGDEYNANLPVSLAAHLPRLIPPHGVRALEAAGLSVEALQLIIEADPPPGPLIDSEDSSGNEIRISLK